MEKALKEQNLQQLELELNAKLEHYTTVDTSSDDHSNTGSAVYVYVYALSFQSAGTSSIPYFVCLKLIV